MIHDDTCPCACHLTPGDKPGHDCLAEVDKTPRAWQHSRKGKIVGYVEWRTGSGKDIWLDIRLTQDNYYGDAGEILTVRESFTTETSL